MLHVLIIRNELHGILTIYALCFENLALDLEEKVLLYLNLGKWTKGNLAGNCAQKLRSHAEAGISLFTGNT